MKTAIVACLVMAAFCVGAETTLGAVLVGSIKEISKGCRGQNAEVESAVDPGSGYAYEAWMGCRGIAFARSTDGAATFSKPQRLPGATHEAWDPTIAVAPDGTVYVAFMLFRHHQNVPVVKASFNRGKTFTQKTRVIPPDPRNWGDRPFLAVGPRGTVYLSWAYGPER